MNFSSARTSIEGTRWKKKRDTHIGNILRSRSIAVEHIRLTCFKTSKTRVTWHHVCWTLLSLSVILKNISLFLSLFGVFVDCGPHDRFLDCSETDYTCLRSLDICQLDFFLLDGITSLQLGVYRDVRQTLSTSLLATETGNENWLIKSAGKETQQLRPWTVFREKFSSLPCFLL